MLPMDAPRTFRRFSVTRSARSRDPARSARRRRLRLTLLFCAGVGLAWVAAAAVLFVWPTAAGTGPRRRRRGAGRRTRAAARARPGSRAGRRRACTRDLGRLVGHLAGGEPALRRPAGIGSRAVLPSRPVQHPRGGGGLRPPGESARMDVGGRRQLSLPHRPRADAVRAVHRQGRSTRTGPTSRLQAV